MCYGFGDQSGALKVFQLSIVDTAEGVSHVADARVLRVKQKLELATVLLANANECVNSANLDTPVSARKGTRYIF